MKPIIQKLWMLIAMLCAFIPASAYDFKVDGFYYNLLSATDLTCEVTSGDVKYAGDIEIPAEVKYNNKTLSIVRIGKSTFSGCSSLTSVSIPDSVTEIGDSAFQGCSSLTSVTIPDSVTEIGASVFKYCSSLTSFTISDSVTKIRFCAFYGCSSLTSVTIPDSVTIIGEAAFSECSSLTSVTIPESVTVINNYTFDGCSSLTSVTIPDSVTKIGIAAFSNCSSLTSVTIPDSVTEIRWSAFSYCSSLTSVTIPDSVTEIESCVFENCSSLSIAYIGKSVYKIGWGLFQDCINLQSVTFSGIEADITWMYWDSNVYYTCLFENCINLKEIKFLYNPEYLDVEYLICRFGNAPLPINHLYIDRDIKWGEYTSECVKGIKQLSLGPNLRHVNLPFGCHFSDMEELGTIYCYSLEPPTIWGFSNVQYMNLVIKVPNEALEAYQQADVWQNFWNLEGFDAAGTEPISDGLQSDVQKTEIGRYDLNGRRVSEDYNGVSIIRYSDGSTKKTVAK